MIDGDDGVSALLLVVILMVGSYALMLSIVNVAVDRDCLKLGYRSAYVTFDFAQYCVTRIDQTDVVVPVSDARRNPR